MTMCNIENKNNEKQLVFSMIVLKIIGVRNSDGSTNYDLGPSASQSSDGDASAASRILVVSEKKMFTKGQTLKKESGSKLKTKQKTNKTFH